MKVELDTILPLGLLPCGLFDVPWWLRQEPFSICAQLARKGVQITAIGQTWSVGKELRDKHFFYPQDKYTETHIIISIGSELNNSSSHGHSFLSCFTVLVMYSCFLRWHSQENYLYSNSCCRLYFPEKLRLWQYLQNISWNLTTYHHLHQHYPYTNHNQLALINEIISQLALCFYFCLLAYSWHSYQSKSSNKAL